MPKARGPSAASYPCPRCHTAIVAGQKFCKSCGLALDPASLAAFQARGPQAVGPRGRTPPAPKISRGRGCLLVIAAFLGLGVCSAAVQGITGTGATTPATATPAVAVLAQVATVAPTTPPTPAPTDTAAPATATAVPPPATPYASGGLGLSKAAWEAVHGAGSNSKSIWSYEGKTYTLFFWGIQDTDQATWPIDILSRVWPESGALPLDQARQAAAQLIPTDATLQRTAQESDPPVFWEVYHSASLATRYPSPGKPADPWGGAAPGTFLVEYNDLPVRYVRIALGDKQYNDKPLPTTPPTRAPTPRPAVKAPPAPAATARPVVKAPPAAGSGCAPMYDIHGPRRYCADFPTHAAAQCFFVAAGGVNGTARALDADHDGIACESLP